MTRKKKKQPKRRSTYAEKDRLVMRTLVFRSATADAEGRSIETVIATENPIARFDYQRGEVIQEVLRMDGVKYRGDRKQVPIVDSHAGYTTRNVFGSVREIRVDGSELIGRAFFASDDDSQDAFGKVKDGHITDFSITAQPLEVVRVERGETFKGVAGPAEVITSWTPIDASLVATGADETSTVRQRALRSYELPHESDKDEEMKISKKRLAELRLKGLPEDIEDSDSEAILDWVIENNIGAPDDDDTTDDVTSEDEEDDTDDATDDVTADADHEAELVSARKLALTNERKRTATINALVDKAGLERSVADDLITRGVSVAAARKAVLDTLIENNGDRPSNAPRVTGEGQQRLRSACRDGLIIRALGAAGHAHRVGDTFGEAGPAQGAEDFHGMSMLRIAERMLISEGINVERMSPRDIAMVSMGHQPTIRRLNITRAGEGYHSTGSFANLLLDAANKTLLAGYDEAPYTWNVWARQASSVADFKNINRIRYSESPDLKHVPENGDYPEGEMSDSKESYSVDKFGRLFSVTWETIVNDDMDAISRTPAMHGNAARRTQNKKVYEVLTANNAMADGTALFHSGHSNLAGSGAAPSVTTLNAMFTAMRTQTGLRSDVTINVMPQYIIIPVALEATVMQLLGSLADPSQGGDTTGSSGVVNIYGPNGRRSLTIVADPVLDGNSTTAWYAAASTGQIDTVELSFLQGEETPVLENEFDFDKDVWKYKIRQTFGVKAIDWRGLYKNAGA